MNHKEASTTQKLEAYLIFFHPMRVEQPTVAVGTLTPRNLPRQLSITCLSTTRPDLGLKAEAITSKALEKADPFVVGAAVRLSREECNELEEKSATAPSFALTAFR